VTGSPTVSRVWSPADCRWVDGVPTRAIVLDIEGTVSPIAFVRDVLFPYARVRLAEVIRARYSEPQIAALLHEAAQLAGTPHLEVGAAIELFLSWSDADRKMRPLKTLQGFIWRQGYIDGSLRAPLYPDVLPALREWRSRGIDLYVYSSGSVEAQRLLFQFSEQGDLREHFSGHFDTAVGPKVEVESYRSIRRTIGVSPGELLFLSDSAAEIGAATAAGWRALQVQRDAQGSNEAGPPSIASFANLVL
jgi:enolase-phosphatase E1